MLILNQLIWFRQDLRCHDHVALWHATQAGECYALVILSPQQWQLHHDAPIKIDFYLKQLHDLQTQLAKLNIPLIVQTIDTWQNIPAYLKQLSQKLQIETLHANMEFGLHEQQRDAQVQNTIFPTQAIYYQDRTLFPVASIRNKTHQPYQVFGAFKKVTYARLSLSLPHCYPLPEPQSAHILNTLPTANIPCMQDFNLATEIQTIWPIGELIAQQRLDEFIADRLEYYHHERNLPQVNGTSQLSAYLNIGILSARQCLNALFREQNGYFHLTGLGQQTWLDELLWREFYQHILFDFPRVSKHLPFKMQTQNIAWRDAPEDLQAWQQGQTGIPIVDAGMRQLLATGWMHNRVRMICAMFLCKNLLIDWRLGEQWFMQHLIDGDLAANNGGWQWCASTGTDAVPYFRIFNPISQSKKFDANGDYLRQWLPELAHLDAKNIHEPYAKLSDLVLDYPQPIVDLKLSRQRAIDAFKQLAS